MEFNASTRGRWRLLSTLLTMRRRTGWSVFWIRLRRLIPRNIRRKLSFDWVMSILKSMHARVTISFDMILKEKRVM